MPSMGLLDGASGLFAFWVACVTSLAVWLAWGWWRYRALDGVPGPFFASVTRLWHARLIWNGTHSRALLRLHDRLGPFVRIAPDEVSVAHPDGLRTLLLEPLRKGYWYETLTFPDSTYKTPMATVDPREKMARSRLLASAYATASLLRSEDAIDRQVALLLGWMDDHAASGRPMDLSHFFTFTAYDLMGEVIFSKPFGFLEQGADIEGALRQGQAFGAYVAALPYFPWLQRLLVSPAVASLQLLPSSYVVRRALGGLRARASNPDARWDYVAHWLRTHEEHPDRLTIKDVQAAVTSNVSAGADTVTCALQSFVYHAIRHPTAWQRLRAEVTESPAEPAVVPFAAAQKMPYLQACIKESMRVLPPSVIGLQRVAPPGGVALGGRTFPAGTVLSVHLPGVLLSRDIWGPDAREFRPERWLGPDAAALERYFIPFGLGYNSCVGQNLVRIELTKILPTIVRRYNIRQVDPDREWTCKSFVASVPADWPVYIARK